MYYNKERSSSRESTCTFPQRRRTPSFSSSLLDAIYRSIDESNGEERALGGQYTRETKTTTKTTMFKNSVTTAMRRGVGDASFLEEEKEVSSTRRRAVMIESWMEKQSSRGSMLCNSASTTSSDSSSGVGGGGGGGVFSSSETESSVRENSTRSSNFAQQRTRPVSEKQQQKPKCEGGFSKTKLRALKIYGELKKVKQPISPGGRISSFLNSIFSSGSGKKVKMCSIGATEDVSYERKSKSACSSVTSYSRSCLSKTPPPRGKPSNGTKRSVRFFPVSVIVDEDSRPCGHKCIYEDDPGLMPMPQKAVKSCSLKELQLAKGSAAEYLRSSYHQKKKNVSEFDFRGFPSYVEDDSDSGGESCSSSDLFELDHLSGIGRYREELPVYETTNFKTNQAIANGFIL